MTDIAMKASSCHLPPSLSPLPARGEWKRGRGINPRNPLAKISIVRFRSKWRERERGRVCGFQLFKRVQLRQQLSGSHASIITVACCAIDQTNERTRSGERGLAHPIVRHPSSYLHHRTHLRRDRACLVVNTRDAIYSRSLPLFPSSRKRISSPFLVFRAGEIGEKETAPEYYAHIYIHLVPKRGTSQSRERTRERIFYAAVESRGGETNRRKNKRKERGREGAIRQADGVSVDLG